MYKDKEKRLQYNRQWSKDSRKFAIEHHLCTCCFKERTYGNERMCLLCKAKAYEYRQKRKESMSEEEYKDFKLKYRDKDLEQKKKVKLERKEKGLCVDCGKRKAMNNRVRCGICLAKDRERHNLKNAELKDPTKNRQYRLENHLCYTCGTSLDKDSKSTVCDKCHKIFSDGAKKTNDVIKIKYSNMNHKLFIK